MKHLRTKDGIYEIRKEYKSPMGDDVYYITGCKDFYSYVVLKQSDSIDELICDERLIARFCNANENIKCLLSEGKTIYGAILVKRKHGEPILNSVAKLNGEGGWVLL